MSLRLAAVSLVLLAVSPVHAKDGKVTTTHVAGTVYMLEGRGGNIGVSVGDDGVILVDDQMPPVLDAIERAVADLSSGPLRFVINTHFHGDHTGNNVPLGERATIVAQTNVRTRLMQPRESGDEEEEPLAPAGWPVVTFDESVSIHLNGEDIRILHLPHAHTDGDAVVYFAASNVVHVGDLLFTGHFPFVDLDHGGTIDGYLAGLERVLAEFPPDAKVIPGHGPLSTMEDVRAQRDMIAKTTGIVRARMDEGVSLDEAKSAGLPEEYESFAWDFCPTSRWIETIWKSTSR